MKGDLITEIDGRPVRTMDDMLAAIGDKSVGTKLPVTVLRSGDLEI